MPERVRGDVLAGDGGAGPGRVSGVDGDEPGDRVAAEPGAAAGGEQRVFRLPAAFLYPCPQDLRRVRGQRGAALLAAFAVAAQVGAVAEVGVGDGQAGELADPQPGVDGGEQERVITPAVPRVPVGCGGERLGFRAGQPGDGRLGGPFGGDRQDLRDQLGMLGIVQRRVAEERADRGQPRVAGRDAAAPLFFQVGEERADRSGVQVGDRQLVRLAAGPARRRRRAAG